MATFEDNNLPYLQDYTPFQAQEPFSDTFLQSQMTPSAPLGIAPQGPAPAKPPGIQSFGELFAPPQGIPGATGASSPFVGALKSLAAIYPQNHAMLNQLHQQEQQGIDNATRQQQIALQKKREDRGAAEQFGEMLQNSLKMPPGAMRKYGISAASKFLEKTTGQPMDPDFLKMLHGASDEELAALTDFYTKALKDDPQFGASNVQAFVNSPQLGLKVLGEQSERMKLRMEQEGQKAVADTIQKALGGSQGGTSPQGGLPTPGQPQGQPGALQGASSGKLTPVELQVVAEARKQGVDPAAALAFIRQESQGQFKYGDGGEAAGYFQMHEPAAQDAGQALGVDPSMRHNPRGNIALGVQYVGQKIKQGGGNISEAGKFYNWGSPTFQGKGVENYPQLIADQYTRAQKELGGRAVSEGVAAAPPEFQKKIEGLNTTLAKLDMAKQGLLGSTSKAGKAAFEQLDKIGDDLRKERDALEKRFDPKTSTEFSEAAQMKFGKPASMLTREQSIQVADLVDKRKVDLAKAEAEAKAPTAIKVSSEQGLAAQQRTLVPDPNLYVDERNKALPGDTTIEGLKKLSEERAAKGLPPLRKVAKLGDEQEKSFAALATGYESSKNILERLKDPQVKSIVGNIVTNPEGWYKRAIGGKIKGLNPEQVKFGSALAFDLATLRKSLIGSAQTHIELKTLDPFTPEMSDATPEVIKAKVEALQQGLLRAHRADWDTYNQLDRRVPDKLPDPEEYKYTGEAPTLAPAVAGAPQTTKPTMTAKERMDAILKERTQ